METKQEAIKNAVVTICNGLGQLFSALGDDQISEQHEPDGVDWDSSIWIDSQAAAEMMNCARQTVTNRGESGVIIRKHFGARWRYYKPSIESFMRHKRLIK